MDDRAAELYVQHHTGQAQFAYFQLGVAASAIGFAVHETTGKSLADTPWPIGLGVALWALSFGLGCMGVDAQQRAIRTNMRYLTATKGAGLFAHDADVQGALAKATEIAQGDADRPMVRYRWQMWTLFFGAAAYIGGHVMTMAAIPPPPSAPKLTAKVIQLKR